LTDFFPTLLRIFCLGVVMATANAGAVQGQGHARLTPSLTTAEEYDTNVFATANDPEADFITRASLGLGVDYSGQRWTVSTQYLHELERFDDHPRLNSADARQRAAVAFAYQPTGRTTWAADGEFWKTRTPGELNELTGLILTRATAERMAAHSSLRHRLNLVTSATIDYTATQDHVAGRPQATTHDTSASIERRRSPRTTFTLDYRFRDFLFATPGSTGASGVISHAITAGWTRVLTPRVQFTIDGGPRMTNASVSPEASASLQYHTHGGEFSMTYVRTQATVIGLESVAETQSVAVATAWSLWSSMRVRLAPTFFRSDVEGARADAWVVLAEVDRPLSRGLDLNLSVNSSMQHGGLNLSRPSSAISRHVVLLRLVAGSSSPLR
jgi:hypothetical protein